MGRCVPTYKKGKQGRKSGAKQATFAQKCHAITLYHLTMSESRNDWKAGLTKIQCLSKVVTNKHLKQFKAITIWKWLEESSDSGVSSVS